MKSPVIYVADVCTLSQNSRRSEIDMREVYVRAIDPLVTLLVKV